MGSAVGAVFGSGGKGEAESSGSSSFKNDPVNSYTPYGSVTYKQNDDGSWDQTVSLSENQQQMLNQQEKFGITGGEYATDDDRLNSAIQQYLTNLDTSGLYDLSANSQNLPGGSLAAQFGYKTGYDQDVYDKAYDTLLNTYTQGMDRERDREAGNLEQQLANKGIRQGSEAYNRAMGDFNDTWYGNLNKAQQQAAADAYKYSSQDVATYNNAMNSAVQNAIAANNQMLQEQTLKNTYMYKLLEGLMGNTSVTLPQAYSGAPLSGYGSQQSSSESSSSSGGLLNSIGSWF